MKKIMAMLLVMVMLFSFAGCGGEAVEEPIKEKTVYDVNAIGKALCGTWGGDVEWLYSVGYYQFYGDEDSGLCAYYRIWRGYKELSPAAREGFWGNYRIMENGEIHIYWGMEYNPVSDEWEDIEETSGQLLKYYLEDDTLFITEKMKQEKEGEEPIEHIISFGKIWDYEETVNSEIPYVETEWWEWLKF